MKTKQSTIDELVKTIVDAVQPSRIILFGSAAREEMNPTSDLDVLVVMPDETHAIKIAQQIHVQLLQTDFEESVDVIVATESDLEKYSQNISLVYYSAVQEGKEIYAA